MADGCDNVSKRHGACFGTAVPLSDEDVKRLKLQEASFTEEVRADTDQDGLLDRFTYGVLGHSGADVIGALQYRSGRSSIRGPVFRISTIEQFTMPDRWEAKIKQGGIVLADADAGDRPDIIAKTWDLSSQKFVYHAYLDQNTPRGMPATPMLLGWAWTTQGKKLSEELDFDADPGDYSFSDAELRVVNLLQFHPGPAQFMRVNDNPMSAIPGDEVLSLDAASDFYSIFPLSMQNEVEIEFYDAHKRPVGSFTIHQRLPDMPQQTTPAGMPVIHFHDPFNPRYPDNSGVPMIPDQALSQYDATISSLARWWGNSVAESACRQVVVIHQRYQHNATIGQAETFPGTVFITPETQAASTVRHEAAHNLEHIITGAPQVPLLEPEWNVLSKSDSLAFEFLNESFFMALYNLAGHSEDAAIELFASLTNDLCEPPSIWADALRRWNEGKTFHDKKQLRSDLRRLLQSYQKLVAQHNPSVDAAQMMKPYLALLR